MVQCNQACVFSATLGNNVYHTREKLAEAVGTVRTDQRSGWQALAVERRPVVRFSHLHPGHELAAMGLKSTPLVSNASRLARPPHDQIEPGEMRQAAESKVSSVLIIPGLSGLRQLQGVGLQLAGPAALQEPSWAALQYWPLLR